MKKILGVVAVVALVAGCSRTAPGGSTQTNYWGAGDPTLNASPVPPGQKQVVYAPQAHRNAVTVAGETLAEGTARSEARRTVNCQSYVYGQQVQTTCR